MKAKKPVGKRIACVLALALVCGALAACSGDGGGDDSSGSAVGDKTLIVGESGFAGKFMPIMHESAVDSRIDSLVFEPLMQNNESGEFLPWLAETMDVSEDGLELTFTLKDGVTFSDGEPLTTADVAFTYETVANADYDGPRSYIVSDLEGYEAFHEGTSDEFSGIRVVDEKTIIFVFTEGNASPVNVEFFNFGIMPKHYYEFETWEEFMGKLSEPLGSGPMILEEYKPKQHVKLSANANYWDSANAPKLSGVLIQEVPSETMLGALQTGQVLLGSLESTEENVAALDAIADVEYFISPVNGYNFLYFNCVNGIFEDARVRRALTYGLDRESFIQTEFGGYVERGLGPITPVSWAGTEEGMNTYDFDPAKAEELLKQAGWIKGADGILEKDGKKFSIRFLVNSDAAWTGTLANLAADSWKQLGVDLRIEQMDQSSVISATVGAEPGEKDFDVATLGITLGVDPDPSGGVFDYDAYSAGGLCASGYLNERAQELLKLGKEEFDQAKRKEYYQEWSRLMNQEVPTMLLNYRNTLWGINQNVTGLRISAYTNWTYRITEVEIEG
ncbi:MAG: ABC transporter substrate-binding protein [Clostridiales Family XIII bacterium]|jgi:peptide/nickel transport system substrate-binding protein|nr:ABC transporter substrate-binding protein [Clostridiales Family XIII bacterium]